MPSLRELPVQMVRPHVYGRRFSHTLALAAIKCGCHIVTHNMAWQRECWGRKCPIKFSACASKILGRARILIRNKHKSPDFSDSNENRLVHCNLHPSGLPLCTNDLIIQFCELLWLFVFMRRIPQLPVEGCVPVFSHESGMIPPQGPAGSTSGGGTTWTSFA